MQVGSPPINTGNMPRFDSRTGSRRQRHPPGDGPEFSTIAGYYSQLNAPDTPLYADRPVTSVLGTMMGVHIREQLMALNDKAASL